MIERKIDIFSNTFGDDSKAFYKDGKKLIHAGEYGMYREKCFRELLEFVVNKNQSVTDGFVFSSIPNTVSTQLDIIIYQNNELPLISNNIANFFPIELVNGIGEIKSDLGEKEFAEALRKLAENKMMMDMRRNAIPVSQDNFGEYDFLLSFLVCNKLKFDYMNIDLSKIYEGIPRKYWHNAILSLEDGNFCYKLHFDQLEGKPKENFEKTKKYWNPSETPIVHPYPLHIVELESNETTLNIIKSSDDKYAHIIHFLVELNSVMKYQNQYSFDFVTYLGLDLKDLPI